MKMIILYFVVTLLFCSFLYLSRGQVNAANINFISTDINGWVEQTSSVSTSLNCVSTVSQYSGWIGGNNGVVLRTTNGGALWTNVGVTGLGSNANVTVIYALDSNVCLASATVAVGTGVTAVVRTTNGGANWTPVFTQLNGRICGIKRLVLQTSLFMYGIPVNGRWSLWKSSNAGATWDSAGLYISASGESTPNNALFTRGVNIWFGASTSTINSKIYMSSNSGVNWTISIPAGIAIPRTIVFNTSGIGFTSDVGVDKSTNDGLVWTSIPTPGNGIITSFTNVRDYFWYSLDSSIYFTSNAGANWGQVYSAPAGIFRMVDIKADLSSLLNPVLYGWGVRNNGGITRYYYTIITGNIPVNSNIPDEFSLHQNYPNPFNPSTKIDFDIPKQGLVIIKIYDVTGRELKTLVSEIKGPGSYSIDFNASELNSGVYFYKLTAKGFSETKKMILIK